MDYLAKLMPVVEKALVRLGQNPTELKGADAARFVKPFDGVPGRHLLINVSGVDASLSIYYIGADVGSIQGYIRQFGEIHIADYKGGLNSATTLLALAPHGFFVRAATTSKGVDLEEFLAELFNHQTVSFLTRSIA